MAGQDPDAPFESVRAVADAIMRGAPHAADLGFELLKIERGRATGAARFRPDLMGDPETRVIAGGVVTALLDNLCGVAVVAALDRILVPATLDLRIDYVRACRPGADLFAQAHCHRVARSVAFVRALAYDVDETDPVAHATAVFMLSDPNAFGARS